MSIDPPTGAPGDRALMAFLFTDIEGSTRRWEADAAAMALQLATHDQVLRQAIAGHGGTLFKHTGDGVCATFPSPQPAVEAAISAQRELALPVRMGITTGQAQMRDGDYFGVVLNRAARVMACGHGGQILVDGATADLIEGIAAIDLGHRRLRDITSPVAIFQITAPGLRSEFPPLRTADPVRGNLISRTTSFVGRDDDLATIATSLKSRRLVTLTGVGGVGKTRLALEVASRVRADYTDGVWVVELAAISEPSAVPDALASVLGVKQQAGMTMAASLAAALADRVRLLVFDNCEHVLDAAADLIEQIMAASSTVTVLATSREGLGVDDELLWPIGPLDVSDAHESSAARLFAERAADVAPQVSLSSPAQVATVVEVCRRLDGIPLALELAASRLMSMTLDELHDRLDDRFRLLVGSRRGRDRHHTLRETVQWSYDLLDDTEKRLLTTCSVFAGGFDIGGASALTGYDEYVTLDLLDALVRKSLLVADRSTQSTRFSMLETIRQFAEDELIEAGGSDAARTAHARYFASLEPGLTTLWDGPRQPEAYRWLAAELPNMRAAFRWASDTGDLDTAVGIGICTASLGIWGMELYEAVTWIEGLLERAHATEHPRLIHLYVFAAQCYTTGRIDESVRYADMARELAADGRFAPVPFDAQVFSAGGYISQGDGEQWIELCREVIARVPGTHTLARVALVLALNFVGAQDELDTAADGLLAEADAASNPNIASLAYLAAGISLRRTSPDGAHTVLRKGLMLAQESGNQFAESQLAASLSRLTALHGEPADALRYLALVIHNYRDSGSFALMFSPLVILAALLTRLDCFEPAATIAAFATTPWTERANPELPTAVARLRETLSAATYAECCRVGQAMSNTEMAAYALAHIDTMQALHG